MSSCFPLGLFVRRTYFLNGVSSMRRSRCASSPSEEKHGGHRTSLISNANTLTGGRCAFFRFFRSLRSSSLLLVVLSHPSRCVPFRLRLPADSHNLVLRVVTPLRRRRRPSCCGPRGYRRRPCNARPPTSVFFFFYFLLIFFF